MEWMQWPAKASDAHQQLAEFYRRQLLDNVVPFWLRHGPDPQSGGLWTCLDRDGSRLDSDKAVWPQGRAGWLFARLAGCVPESLVDANQRQSWLALAESCCQFLTQHCYDPQDGRLYFHVTREGRPIRKRRYAFSESFAAIAYGELARVTGDASWAQLAERDFARFVSHHETPGMIAPKFTGARPMRGIGFSMIAINTAQKLRESIGLATADSLIERWIVEIERLHVHADIQCVMESVAVDGSRVDHFDGRLLNPGHAIEAAWFIMWEGCYRARPEWVELGCRMLDWMWQRGWDAEFGGLLYFVDVDGRPVQEYWHDMKFWWPHNEALIATLLAWLATGNDKYWNWHRQVHDWSFQHFADRELGEWYGYLHRDGRLSVPLKGNLWKGPFHLPRMLLYCWQLLENGLPRPV